MKDENVFYFPVVCGDKWGFADREGQIVLDYKYEAARPYIGGFSSVRSKDKYAIIDSSLNIVTPFLYENIRSFYEGMCAAVIDGVVGILNEDLVFTPVPGYTRIHDFSCGLAACRRDDGYYDYIDLDFKVVFKGGWRLCQYSNGMLCDYDEISRKSGFKSLDGHWVIPPKYDYVNNFSESLSLCGNSPNRKTGKVFGLNKDGAEIFCLKGGAQTSCYSEGFAEFWSLKAQAGFIDRSGELVIDPVFDNVNAFSNDLAVVKYKGRQVFIDKSGEIVIDRPFQIASSFRNGLAWCKIEGKFCRLDTTGNVVWREP